MGPLSSSCEANHESLHQLQNVFYLRENVLPLKQSKSSKDYVINDLHALSGKPELSSFSNDLKIFFRDHPLMANLLGNAATFFFIIDFAKMEYIYVSDGIDNIMGYTADEWKSEGMQAAFRTIFPEDKLRLKKLHEDLFQFHFSIPVSDRKKYRYTSDFRVVRKDKQVRWILSQSSMIGLDEAGNAAVGFEICSDITHIKKDNTMTLSITRGDLPGPKQVGKKYYYPSEGTDCFTNREIQVLQQLSLGNTTKEVAHNLGISELTVSKHRMNMMKKAKVNNAAGLVNYAQMNNLL